jgi:hypothetical protein
VPAPAAAPPLPPTTTFGSSAPRLKNKWAGFLNM